MPTKLVPRPDLSQAQRLNQLFFEIARERASKTWIDSDALISAFESLLPFIRDYPLFGTAFPPRADFEWRGLLLGFLADEPAYLRAVAEWNRYYEEWEREGVAHHFPSIGTAQFMNHLMWILGTVWTGRGGVPRTEGHLSPDVKTLISNLLDAFGTHPVFGTGFPEYAPAGVYDAIERDLQGFLTQLRAAKAAADHQA